MKRRIGALLPSLGGFVIFAALLVSWRVGAEDMNPEARALLTELGAYRHKIVYETFRDDNWELYVVNADGSDPVNLTKTPDVDELYPHVSPDGTKVCFLVDEGEGDAMVRSVWYMNMDGTGRNLVAKFARQPCWNPDGTVIAFLGDEGNPPVIRDGQLFPGGKQEYRFTYLDYASVGIFFYDLEAGTYRQHPNKNLHHLYNLCWSPKGDWLVATVHAGMGYSHTNLAVEADGMRVFDLGIGGCRPDFSPDGSKIAWGASDYELHVADVEFSGSEPKVSNEHAVATSPEPMAIYHIDWSPDGKYVVFSHGPHKKRLGWAPEIIGIKAKDWDLYVCRADGANNPYAVIVSDGTTAKEPDWAPVAE